VIDLQRTSGKNALLYTRLLCANEVRPSVYICFGKHMEKLAEKMQSEKSGPDVVLFYQKYSQNQFENEGHRRFSLVAVTKGKRATEDFIPCLSDFDPASPKASRLRSVRLVRRCIAGRMQRISRGL